MMAENSGISWTDHTFNSWWGCVKVSEGCKNCYAETLSEKGGYKVWGKNAGRRFFDENHWNLPRQWNAKAEKAKTRKRVFCNSMADVFEDREDLRGTRNRLGELIKWTQNLDWLLLTKRIDNARHSLEDMMMWPKLPENVWIGTSVENQKRADERIPELLKIPAAIRFLSVEPMLEPINLETCGYYCDENVGHVDHKIHGIDWVIVGGESGPGYRPFDPDWARDIRDQCKRAGIPFFMKQMGGYRKHEYISDLPADLRIREFPQVSTGVETYKQEPIQKSMF